MCVIAAKYIPNTTPPDKQFIAENRSSVFLTLLATKKGSAEETIDIVHIAAIAANLIGIPTVGRYIVCYLMVVALLLVVVYEYRAIVAIFTNI